MKGIVEFIDAFLTAPLQLVLILVVLAIFIYWFVKERPKTSAAQEKIIQEALAEAKKQKDEFKKERAEFFKLMDDYRVQGEKTSALYDKALENSTRAIENNTEVIKNQNIHTQLTNQNLSTLNASMIRVEEKVDKAIEEEKKIKETAQELAILYRIKE